MTGFSSSEILMVLLLGILASCLYIATHVKRLADALSKEPAKPGTAPPHVVFSDRVFAVGPLPGMLDRPLWLKDPSDSFGAFRRCGDWVNQGDPIVSFVVKKRIFRDFATATIRSPIAGRLLFTHLAFGATMQPSVDWLKYLFVIEIPDGEYLPTTLHDSFREFAETIWTHRKSLLQQPPDGSFKPYSDEDIHNTLKQLRETAPVILPKTDAYRERVSYLNLNCPHGIGSATNLQTPRTA